MSKRLNSRVLALATTISCCAFTTGSVLAQDAHDDEIFGSGSGVAPENGKAPSAAKDTPSTTEVRAIVDSLQVGGRLEIRSNSSQEETQKLPEASYSELKRADVYFDTRPSKDLRAFLRARFFEEIPVNPAVNAAVTGSTACDPCVKTELDELWFKWDIDDSVFFTYGKQHLKWGSSQFWNPTDFTALSTRDPFALFDSRLGQELLKIHIPNEKRGFNYYALLQLGDVERNDKIGLALRGEFAVAGLAEVAISFQERQSNPIRYGLDVSSAVGPIDVTVETALTKRQTRHFYRGGIDPAAGELPESYQDKDKAFVQLVGGLKYAFKYNSDDALTVGGEYFLNDLGYSDRKLELYSLVQGDSEPLYAGKRYVGAYLQLPNPGSWNDTSFFLNGLRNESDGTSVVRLTTTWQLYKEATIEAFVSGCQGDYGELCFRIPETFEQLAAIPNTPPEQQQLIAALPTKRTKQTAGVAISIAF